MSLCVASLHVYPVKSLGGFAVNEAQLTDRGFAHDRRWMLVDADGRFISQREVAVMACLHTSPMEHGFRITDVRDGATINLPWTIADGKAMSTTVWDDRVEVIAGPQAASDQLSAQLGLVCTVVYMPDRSVRPTDPHYATAITSLSDGFPFLIISQASLNDLNGRMETPIGMERFRPNIVVAGGPAFQEDEWRSIAIGGVTFHMVKPCARCVITTTDQSTGERNKEPLRTLVTYRKRISGSSVKVDFGMNAVADPKGKIAVTDPITILAER